MEICTEVNRPPDALPAASASLGYTRHRPEFTVLYAVVRDNLATLYGAISDGALEVRVPKHARRELEAYLGCGIPCWKGFARFRCRGCGESRIVAFSCKGRGFCPSCLGRRMCAAAANLTECVLPPESGLRQWVLTFPFAWRATLSRNGALLGSLTRIFEETVHGFYAHRARQEGHDVAKTGSIAVLQRTSAGLLREGPDEEQDAEANLAASAVSGQAPPAGPQWRVRLAPLERRPLAYDKPLCASQDGFTLHAATRAGALDASGREALLRYVLRPPIAQGKIEHRPDGLVRIVLKKPYADGTVAVDLDPLSLLARLAACVPPPRHHTVRYAGVLAAASQWRSRIAPCAEPDDEPRKKRRSRYRPSPSSATR